jgi:hypothetical protein
MTQNNLSIILINAGETLSVTTDEAVILQYEPLQVTGGYQPWALTYTAGTSYFDSVRGYQRTPDFNPTFSEESGGLGYSFTHIFLWQGRSPTQANKAVTSVNASTNEITVTAHGLSSGDRAFVTSSGTRPGGLTIQRYWVEAVSANVIKFHTNSALTAEVDITSSGSGTLTLRYANGTPFYYDPLNGTVNAGAPRTFQFFYERG